MPTKETRDREFGALMSVPDQYRKIVLSMDSFDFSRDGIEHCRLPDFIAAEEWREWTKLCLSGMRRPCAITSDMYCRLFLSAAAVCLAGVALADLDLNLDLSGKPMRDISKTTVFTEETGIIRHQPGQGWTTMGDNWDKLDEVVNLGGVYDRLGWRTLEPKEGIYDWRKETDADGALLVSSLSPD